MSNRNRAIRNLPVSRPITESLEPRLFFAGDGLSAVYFDNTNFTSPSGDNPVTRVESGVALASTTGSPAPGIAAGTFSTRWAGEIKPAATGGHTFRTVANGGVRVWVDDNLLIDDWSDTGAAKTTTAASVTLTAGQRYRVVLEYFDSSGAAECRLQWQAPGSSSFVAVPQAQLYSNQRDLPDFSGWINVRDFGAEGNGTDDDTTAIRDAFLSGKRLYFPNGVYKITDTLVFGTSITNAKNVQLQGQHRDNAVIRLADNDSDFQNPGAPKPMVSFYEGSSSHQDAFRNHAYDLTFNVGKDNPGAAGLRFTASNQGGIDNVNIIAEPDAGGVRDGYRGLDLTKKETGPELFKNMLIRGFDYGIEGVAYGASATFEHITLREQRVLGIKNEFNSWFMRGLDADLDVPLYDDGGSNARLVLLDSTITGPGSGTMVTTGSPALFRNVTASGYAKYVDNDSGSYADVTSAAVLAGEHSNRAPVGAFTPVEAATLNLPILETPVPEPIGANDWVRVENKSFMRRDIHSGTVDGTYVVDVPNGSYTVTVHLGDSENARDDVDVFAENVLVVDNQDTAVGSVVARTFNTTVSDGQLTLRLHDDGGANTWSIAGIEVSNSGGFSKRLDLKHGSYAPAGGYTAAPFAVYSAGAGFGWQSLTNLNSRYRSGQDDTQDVRDAVALANSTGKTALYFVGGQEYILNDTVEITGGIRYVLGNESSISLTSALSTSGNAVFRFTGLTAPEIIFERFSTGYPSVDSNFAWFEHDTDRTVVLKHIVPHYVSGSATPNTAFRQTANGTGDVFIEDMSGTHWRFGNGVNVYARQFNTESRFANDTNIINDGATVWIFGLKTEGANTVIETKNGGKTELLGGYLSPNDPVPSTTPAFVITDASFSGVFINTGNDYGQGLQRYARIATETRGGTTNHYSATNPWFYNGYVAANGSLAGSAATASGDYNLTTTGTVDWAKWGNANISSFDRKSTGGSQISNWATLGTGTATRSYGSLATHTWTDGSPTAAATASKGYVRVGGAVGRGFEFTAAAPAGVQRTLKIYVGLQYAVTGLFEASLLDGSAVDYSTTIANGSGSSEHVITITYTAATATSLRLRWTVASGTGNVYLRGASLS